MPDKRRTANDLTTLRDLIRWGTSQFNAAELAFAQGMPTALDEAVYLCLSALHLPPDFSVEYFDCVLTMDERLKVLDLYEQRIEQRKPAAYITHEAWFAGLGFYVDERVLIPRSPIAELIEQQFSFWVDDPEQVGQILDMCTGSGCIAIACAHAFEQARVDASDISADALAVAAINREQHGLEDRMELIESDLFESVPDRAYDLIICNPPYVTEEEMTQLPEEFACEPAAALVAGKTGMDFVLPVLIQAPDYLSDDGLLVVEVGYSQGELEQLLPEVPFFWLEFEHGGQGVFAFSTSQLRDYREAFRQALNEIS